MEKIAGLQKTHGVNRDLIPYCIYSHPQVASVGLTEGEAAAAGYTVRIGKFPFRGNGKALCTGETDGLVKPLFDDDTEELLGAHIVGVGVTEMIQGFTIAKTLESTKAELMQIIMPPPTLSEMFHESVLCAYDRPLHL